MRCKRFSPPNLNWARLGWYSLCRVMLSEDGRKSLTYCFGGNGAGGVKLYKTFSSCSLALSSNGLNGNSSGKALATWKTTRDKKSADQLVPLPNYLQNCCRCQVLRLGFGLGLQEGIHRGMRHQIGVQWPDQRTKKEGCRLNWDTKKSCDEVSLGKEMAEIVLDSVMKLDSKIGAPVDYKEWEKCCLMAEKEK